MPSEISTNNYTFGINDFGSNSLCAFFSLIFGVNQYVVLHLFGIFNFLILSIGVSLFTHKLTHDFTSVVFSVSLFVFGLPLVDFISIHAENSSFLFGLGWALMLIYFWKDVGWIQRILSLVSAYLPKTSAQQANFEMMLHFDSKKSQNFGSAQAGGAWGCI